MNSKLSLIVIAAFVGLAIASVVSAGDQDARKKELKETLFAAELPLKVEEVLPLLKELKKINDADLAKIPASHAVTPLGEEGEVRLLNQMLEIFIAAGEVDQEKAKNLDFVNHLTYKINNEVYNGIYYGIHPYLKAGVTAWWAAYKQHHKQ